MLNKIIGWWQRLWVRKDEFHSSLYINVKAVRKMEHEERLNYFKDLQGRRDIAHANDK